MVGRFIRGVTVKYVESCPPLSMAYLGMDTFKEVEVLKHFAYKSLIMSPMLKVVAYRGKDIVSDIFSPDFTEGSEGTFFALALTF